MAYHLTLLSIILPILIFLFFLHKYVTKPLKLPPSPPKLPILGHLHKLGNHPHRTLAAISARYGELMLLYFGSKPTLIVSSSSMAKEILKNYDIIFSNRGNSIIFEKLLYNSKDISSCNYGEYWRQLKSIFVVQLLSKKRVRSFKGVREEETLILVKNIEKNNGLVLDLSEMFTNLTNDIVCRVAFGRKYSENKKNGVDFKEILKEFVELLGSFNVGDFIPWLSWVAKINGLEKRLDNVAKKFDLVVEEILNEHLDKKSQLENSNEQEKVKDFVDILLEIQRENCLGFPLERDSIKALILDAFAAGTDTAQSVLEWAMTELLRHPQIMKELQKEVRDIVGKKNRIVEDDLVKMKYLKAVIKETLRLHPPAPLLFPHESTQDVIIKGYTIPKKTRVIFNAWAIQRDSKIWNDPEEFRPERFLNSMIDYKGNDMEFIPFGSGRRICPGISFAIANDEFVLATLMFKFNWILPMGFEPETMDMSESSGVTIHRNTPLLVVAIPHITSPCQ